MAGCSQSGSASLAGFVRAVQGMNITDKSFRLHKLLRGNSGTKILWESNSGDLGS